MVETENLAVLDNKVAIDGGALTSFPTYPSKHIQNLLPPVKTTTSESLQQSPPSELTNEEVEERLRRINVNEENPVILKQSQPVEVKVFPRKKETLAKKSAFLRRLLDSRIKSVNSFKKCYGYSWKQGYENKERWQEFNNLEDFIIFWNRIRMIISKFNISLEKRQDNTKENKYYQLGVFYKNNVSQYLREILEIKMKKLIKNIYMKRVVEGMEELNSMMKVYLKVMKLGLKIEKTDFLRDIIIIYSNLKQYKPLLKPIGYRYSILERNFIVYNDFIQLRAENNRYGPLRTKVNLSKLKTKSVWKRETEQETLILKPKAQPPVAVLARSAPIVNQEQSKPRARAREVVILPTNEEEREEVEVEELFPEKAGVPVVYGKAPLVVEQQQEEEEEVSLGKVFRATDARITDPVIEDEKGCFYVRVDEYESYVEEQVRRLKKVKDDCKTVLATCGSSMNSNNLSHLARVLSLLKDLEETPEMKGIESKVRGLEEEMILIKNKREVVVEEEVEEKSFVTRIIESIFGKAKEIEKEERKLKPVSKHILETNQKEETRKEPLQDKVVVEVKQDKDKENEVPVPIVVEKEKETIIVEKPKSVVASVIKKQEVEEDDIASLFEPLKKEEEEETNKTTYGEATVPIEEEKEIILKTKSVIITNTKEPVQPEEEEVKSIRPKVIKPPPGPPPSKRRKVQGIKIQKKRKKKNPIRFSLLCCN